ncbi:MAG: DUF308 domain-containing protein [Alistipes sp.]|nr:DUF308 domain-containing protein [Alistipes sp.]
MNTLKNSFQNIIGAIVQLIIGVLLLCKPDAFTKGIIIAFGIFLVLFAIKNIIVFFKADAMDAYKQRNASKGLLSLIAGIFCIFKAEWFLLTFPILTLLYGVAILVYGIQKIEFAALMKRLRNKVWIWVGINSLISIICAIIIITDPFDTSRALWMFAGIYLIAQAVLDIAISVLVEKRNK